MILLHSALSDSQLYVCVYQTLSLMCPSEYTASKGLLNHRAAGGGFANESPAVMQADFVKLRKKAKCAADKLKTLEAQNKALQILCAKQRLKMDELAEEASQAGQSL